MIPYRKSQMNCHDAREQFPALLTGQVGLTELVQVEAHVSECPDCAEALKPLSDMRARHRPGRPRVPVDSVAEPLDSSVADDLTVRPRRRRLRPVPLWLMLGVVAVTLGMGAGLAVYVSERGLESLVAAVGAVPPGGRHVEVAADRPIPPPPRETPPASVPNALSPAESGDSNATEAKQSPAPASLPSQRTRQPAPEAKDVGRPKESPPRAEASKSAVAPGIASTTKPERTAATTGRNVATTRPASPEPQSEPASLEDAPRTDVAVQLSVHDRGEAERDLTLLLARLGGTKLGRSRDSTLMVTIPRSNYGEFTRGLAQIGAWQMEAGRSSLPDPVHVTVKLAR